MSKLKQQWFSEPDRKSLIEYAQSNIDRVIQSMARPPSQVGKSNSDYELAILQANIVWYNTLLYIAKGRGHTSHITPRINHPLSRKEYLTWRETMLLDFGNMPPPTGFRQVVYIQQLAHNLSLHTVSDN